jgi:hypothetical protein
MTLFSALCLLSFNLDCYHSSSRKEEEYQIVTKELIYKYRINDPVLTHLLFYISEPLILEASNVEFSAEADPVQHKLLTQKKENTETITIEQYLPGRCIKLIPEHKTNPWLPSIRYGRLKINLEPMRMHVNFDKYYLDYLVFVADEKSGKFMLEFDEKSKTVEYAGRRYRCKDGCDERLLLFDVESKPDSINNYEYPLPGSPFPLQNDSSVPPWVYLLAGLIVGFLLRSGKP